ncbi:MAG: protein arginine kinase [Bacillota bacterium]
MSRTPASFSSTISRWMTGDGNVDDVVVSTRLRLARNLSGHPFPPSAARGARERVLGLVSDGVDEISRNGGEDLTFYPLDEIEELDRWILVEKHLASPNLMREDGASGVVLDKDETTSVMVNEEDHLRIQCLLPGFDLRGAWARADEVDDRFSSVLDYAFHPRYGYLTACPTNVGTGLRGSVMVHLPGLVLMGGMEPLMSGLSKVGAVVRGVYGEGSDAEGNLFQISNRISLGSPEEEILDNLEAVARELISRERSARESLLNRDRDEIEDRIYRSYGILTNARKMTSEEALGLLSMVRLGADLNLLAGNVRETFSELIVRIRRASLQRVLGEELGPEERDVRRASLIRKRLISQN